MLKRLKDWLSLHLGELARGLSLGLIGTIVFLFFSWTPPPRPRIGEKQATVIAQYGMPEKILRTEQSPTAQKHFPFVYLYYRNGFFKSNVTIITIDSVGDRVVNVTQDKDSGY